MIILGRHNSFLNSLSKFAPTIVILRRQLSPQPLSRTLSHKLHKFLFSCFLPGVDQREPHDPQCCCRVSLSPFIGCAKISHTHSPAITSSSAQHSTKWLTLSQLDSISLHIISCHLVQLNAFTVFFMTVIYVAKYIPSRRCCILAKFQSRVQGTKNGYLFSPIYLFLHYYLLCFFLSFAALHLSLFLCNSSQRSR